MIHNLYDKDTEFPYKLSKYSDTSLNIFSLDASHVIHKILMAKFDNNLDASILVNSVFIHFFVMYSLSIIQLSYARLYAS
jgi:hypothetical protein